MINLGLEYPVPIYDYPVNPNANPHHRITGQRIVVIEDISDATKGTHATLNNHAGSAFPLDYSKDHLRCAKPFREISVRWDGNVAICCNDWPGVYKVGNVVTDGLETIWQSPAFNAARKALYNGRRDLLNPCHGCDATSYRPGLLPDPKGQADLPLPNAADRDVMDRSASGAPYTGIVRPPIPPKDGILIPLSVK
jgi:radical SAM protein with 4Fe4S-binding SPASM domain